MLKEYDMIIVGAGIVGLSAALSLASAHCKIALIDAKTIDAQNPGSDLRVYAINQASKHLFKQLKIWDEMDAALISPYRHMHVWDAKSQASIDFDASEIQQSELGFILQESLIKKALLEKIASEAHIDPFPLQKVKELSRLNGKVCIASDTERWEAPFVMVADGAESPLRQQLQVPIHTKPYFQDAIIASVQTEKPHQQTAWQVFTSRGTLAFLPLKDPHQCSIVWSTSKEEARALLEASTLDFNKALAEAFHHRLGEVQVLSPRHHFPLIMRQAEAYAGSDWLLLGDAAHTIHPLAGLGLNLGLADLSCLLSKIGCFEEKPLFNKKILKAYQRERKSAVWQCILMVGALKTLFTNPLAPVSFLRGLGLKICDNLTPLKRLLIEHANGL